MKIIDMAAERGDFETAAKYAWTLLEHTPKEDGEAIIDESAAKPKQLEAGPRGPLIQIVGLKIGGLNQDSQAQLPEAQVIDVEPESK